MLVSEKWATNYTMQGQHSTPHYEKLTVSFRPHFLLREFSHFIVYSNTPINMPVNYVLNGATVKKN